MEDIQKIVERFISKRKGWEQFNTANPKKGTKYPEYWSGYNYAARMYDSILPHSRSDVYPEHLLSVRAPNQTDAQANYIKENYKATTLSVFEDFKSTISRAFFGATDSHLFPPKLSPPFIRRDRRQRTDANHIKAFGHDDCSARRSLGRDRAHLSL